MFSIRNLTRSAPRAVARLTTSSMRSGAVRPGAICKTSAASVLRSSTGSTHFSTSVSRREVIGETIPDISAKLESELQLEKEMKAQDQEPASIKDFLKNSPFELIETPGQETVKLVRSFANEKITVSFSISDLSNSNYDPYSEEAALEDEELDEDPQSSNKQANEHVEEADEADDELDHSIPPINLSILVEKPGKMTGALNIDATAQDGHIVIDNMYFYEDAQLVKMESFEYAHKRGDVYSGPPFSSLDEDLQILMEQFLEERGISEAMAVFIPDYVDAKEQKEYIRWLGNVKAFVDA